MNGRAILVIVLFAVSAVFFIWAFLGRKKKDDA